MNQTDIFLAGEGDAWFERNRDKIGDNDPAHDPVETEIQRAGLSPVSVLEIGCANGWRLQRLHEQYGCTACGIDPSAIAVAEARMQPGLRRVERGTAIMLPWMDRVFDVVIFGFCLYLCEPRDLFHIVEEADRVLKFGGTLIIYDFADIEPPFARAYEHRKGILCYHIDHAQFWLAHPWYSLVNRQPYPDGLVTVLHKDERIEVLP